MSLFTGFFGDPDAYRREQEEVNRRREETRRLEQAARQQAERDQMEANLQRRNAEMQAHLERQERRARELRQQQAQHNTIQGQGLGGAGAGGGTVGAFVGRAQTWDQAWGGIHDTWHAPPPRTITVIDQILGTIQDAARHHQIVLRELTLDAGTFAKLVNYMGQRGSPAGKSYSFAGPYGEVTVYCEGRVKPFDLGEYMETVNG